MAIPSPMQCHEKYWGLTWELLRWGKESALGCCTILLFLSWCTSLQIIFVTLGNWVTSFYVIFFIKTHFLIWFSLLPARNCSVTKLLNLLTKNRNLPKKRSGFPYLHIFLLKYFTCSLRSSTTCTITRSPRYFLRSRKTCAWSRKHMSFIPVKFPYSLTVLLF